MYFTDTRSHHLEAWDDAPLMQMGQPSVRVAQRQLTDNLPSARVDMHGLEREVQFSDFHESEMQAIG
jgi:hypothetical protein